MSASEPLKRLRAVWRQPMIISRLAVVIKVRAAGQASVFANCSLAGGGGQPFGWLARLAIVNNAPAPRPSAQIPPPNVRPCHERGFATTTMAPRRLRNMRARTIITTSGARRQLDSGWSHWAGAQVSRADANAGGGTRRARGRGRWVRLLFRASQQLTAGIVAREDESRK